MISAATNDESDDEMASSLAVKANTCSLHNNSHRICPLCVDNIVRRERERTRERNRRRKGERWEGGQGEEGDKDRERGGSGGGERGEG